jgi:hypothetical protein
MPPKKWPQYRRERPQLTPGDRSRYFSREKLGTNRLFTEYQIKKWSGQARNLRHAQAAGRQDPLSIMLVLDLLLRIEPEYEIRARDVTDLLSVEHPDIWWDSVTTGRILTKLKEVIDQYCTAEAGRRPLEMETDRDGAYYVMVPSISNWIMLGEMRERMGTLAEQVIENENAEHARHPRPDFPWEAFEGLEYRTAGPTKA